MPNSDESQTFGKRLNFAANLYYEQQLILQQVAQLTGRRFLGDYSSDEQQYHALMDAGITFAQQFNLRPGIALSPTQIAQLTSDIVWLVEQSVTLPDGTVTTALAPKLYARVQSGELQPSGSLISGASVDIQASGDLVNTGAIQGRRLVSISADNISKLDGGVLQAQNLLLSANTLNCRFKVEAGSPARPGTGRCVAGSRQAIPRPLVKNEVSVHKDIMDWHTAWDSRPLAS